MSQRVSVRRSFLQLNNTPLRDIPQFVYSFISGWTFEFFRYFGYWGHLCTVFVRTYVFSSFGYIYIYMS